MLPKPHCHKLSRETCATLDSHPPALYCPEAPNMALVAFPQLQKMGGLLDTIIRYLVNVETVGSMLNVTLFAEIALMAKECARVLRPIMRHWKQDTKHDRALLRQLRQKKYSCTSQDVWLLGFLRGTSQGASVSIQPWMYYPLTWMTSFRRLSCSGWIMQNEWVFGFSITTYLSQRDKYSLSALCWCAHYWTSYQSGLCILETRSS